MRYVRGRLEPQGTGGRGEKGGGGGGVCALLLPGRRVCLAVLARICAPVSMRRAVLTRARAKPCCKMDGW